MRAARAAARELAYAELLDPAAPVPDAMPAAISRAERELSDLLRRQGEIAKQLVDRAEEQQN